MLRQSIIIHLQPQTFPHKIHILDLVPFSSSHWSLSFCATKDHNDPPNYETHDGIPFSFVWLTLHMTTFPDCIATTVSISLHCPLAPKNTVGSPLLFFPKWSSLTSKDPQVQTEHSKMNPKILLELSFPQKLFLGEVLTDAHKWLIEIDWKN